MLIEKKKYLHMQKCLPIEAEIYACSKTISINQRIAHSATLPLCNPVTRSHRFHRATNVPLWPTMSFGHPPCHRATKPPCHCATMSTMSPCHHVHHVTVPPSHHVHQATVPTHIFGQPQWPTVAHRVHCATVPLCHRVIVPTVPNHIIWSVTVPPFPTI